MSQPTPSPAYALPTIHMNGTGARALADEYHAVYMALAAAAESLQKATCNARDFYVQEPTAWGRAQREREEAFRKLSEVQSYAKAWMGAANAYL